ncbi:16S rRNA (cytidine1402-2'-O)-methyltransferase [Carboxydocella sporoproducens DSM 16521]|uniref:Ribosomal RNA small subunit methyltransferase I n=2 Tax=Carboxydocella TaxID=178898 RepID=A0A1T4QKG4_9FIRM|nr:MULTISPECIES: 16S rRNA (cytidine(1402)-2'-O)-methyltransferase [Carboxydocella]AVX19238.1 16S rRNA (cytidine1402-2'-O)-methyltransferase [Carboxydocella thermautotrophica]AVX29651.1 16S rRNA (cytidine1402-2'-O)-methyltransferase [Carboxydocella thermautotrophica]SKA04273.1 16S rRNA (cytidine1402-2'-O)-methyltransferase [Carboxydocella sporoproducens DSM 16521]
MSKGVLYVCPTPIGNLEDITLRVLRVLKEVDLIAAEDTRHTIKLLNHFQISTPLTSYHEHNETSKGPKLIDQLQKGKKIALVSDAGMPGISDPGLHLIDLAWQAGIKVEVLPGPNAGLTALVAAGMAELPFTFFGFLPHHKKERRQLWQKLRQHPYTLVFYEAPHRLRLLLEEIREYCPTAQIAIARELTKVHEEIVRGQVEEIMHWWEEKQPRGEFVVILNPGKKEGQNEEETETHTEDRALMRARQLMETGMSLKEAARQAAAETGFSRREIYQRLLAKE